jgi:hypothetical protein
MSTPCCHHPPRFGDVPITRHPRTKVEEIVRNRGITLLNYQLPDKSALSLLVFKPWEDMKQLYNKEVSTNEDMLWHTGWFCNNGDLPRPGWAGFMHKLNMDSNTFETYSVSADIRMHPIIVKNPNDYSCIYSTLVYSHSKLRFFKYQLRV